MCRGRISDTAVCAACISMIRFQICHHAFPGKFSAAGRGKRDGPADLEKKYLVGQT